MNNVKKWLSLSLAGAMLMGALAGCGGNSQTTGTPRAYRLCGSYRLRRRQHSALGHRFRAHRLRPAY